MTSPRLRRRRIQSALVWKTCTGIGFLVLTVTCGVNLTLRLSATGTSSLRQRQLQEEPYPGSFVDLWPDDRNTESYRSTLLSCFPGYDETQDCPVRLQEDGTGDATLRIALVHPPGRIGDVFVDYMNRVLHLPAEQSHPIQLAPTSEIIEANHNFSMIIRLVTLPVLLEAADAALSLHNETDNLQSLTMNDLMDLVRYTIRWQCHITQRTKDTALLTITLDRMIGFPSSTTKKLQWFLGITPNPETKKNRVDMKKLPLVVMDRINAASALVQAVQPSVPTPRLSEVISQVIEEEVQASQDGSTCRSMSEIGDSEVTSLVKQLS